MCFWVKYWQNEEVLREVPIHADTTEEARDIFKHDFPGVSQFELVTP